MFLEVVVEVVMCSSEVGCFCTAGLHHLQEGAFEPLELVYLTRHCSIVLSGSQQTKGSKQQQQQADILTRPQWVQQCLKDAFAALRAAKLPPEWARLNMKFPPYGIPDADPAAQDGTHRA